MTGDGGKDGGHEEARHPIGVVTQRTGLTTHVLRAWERRYGVVEPDRSEGGHRLYSDADVERLRLLHRLTLGGRQIGQVAHLSTEGLRDLLREDRAAEAAAPRPSPEGDEERSAGLLEAAFRAVGELDAEALDGLLRRGALTLSTAAFLDHLLVPLMERIGDAWADEELRPAHEHLASAVVVRVAGWLIDNFDPGASAPTIVAATPAGTRHELGALAAAAVAASEGWRVRYLGPDLPAEDIALAAERSGARAVALSVLFPAGDTGVAAEVRHLRRALPAGVAVLVGGSAAPSYREALEETGATRLADYGGLRTALRALTEAEAAPT